MTRNNIRAISKPNFLEVYEMALVDKKPKEFQITTWLDVVVFLEIISMVVMSWMIFWGIVRYSQ